MRVGIDGRIPGAPGGVGRYAACLLAAMRSVAPEVTWVPCGEPRPSGWLRRFLLDQDGIPRFSRKGRIDLFHGPKNFLPYRRLAVPAVVTIHDLLPVTQPGTERWLAWPYWRLALRGVLRNASQVITGSRYSRDAFLAETGFPPERVTAVGYGCPRLIPHPDREAAGRTLSRLGIDGPYLLTVATLQPRKNHAGLLAAFGILCRQGYPGRLVVAGRAGWRFRGLARAAQRSGAAARVTWLGFVPDADLAALYSRADAFLYPSLAEGFGFPPLEAASFGTPVVASRAGGLLEALGEGALWVDPMSPGEIARATDEILAHDSLRRRLSAAGRAAAARHTWEEAARGTVDVYRRAVA